MTVHKGVLEVYVIHEKKDQIRLALVVGNLLWLLENSLVYSSTKYEIDQSNEVT